MKKAILALSFLLVGYNGYSQSLSLGLSIFSKDSAGLSRHLTQKLSELGKLSNEKLTALESTLENQILSVPNKKVQFSAFWKIGLYFRDRRLHQPAIGFMENMLAIAQDDSNLETKECIDALAMLYKITGEPGKTLDVLTSYLEQLEKKHDLEGQARNHSMLADLYFQNDEFAKCLEECSKVDSLCRLIPGGPKGYLWNIWVNSWNTSGLTYYKLKNNTAALIYFDSTLRIAQRKGDDFMIGLVNGNRSPIYIDIGDYPKAIEGSKSDIRSSKKNGDLSNAANSALLLCRVYTIIRRFDLAQLYLDSATMWYPSEMNGYAREQFYMVKSRLAAATGHFEEAYKLLLKDKAIRDSINKVVRPIYLTKAISKANLAEREQKIELLKNKSLLQEKQLQLRNVLIGSSIIVLGLLLFSSVVYYRRYEQKKRDSLILKEKNDDIESMLEEIQSQHETVVNQKEEIETLNTSLEELVQRRTAELEKKNQELDTFIYRASHDIRRPITTILGLDNVFKLLVKDPVAEELFTLVSTTAKSMDNMLYKMRLIYELNQVDDSREKIWLDQFMQKAIIWMEQELQKKEIDLRTECTNVAIEGNDTLLSIVMKNLIENSIQFTRPDLVEKPFIRIACQSQADQVVITVEDNGIGIEEDQLSKIFDLYFRGTSRSNGNGLGLYLVKKALERMGGTIAVQSTFGKGTKFTILLGVES